MGFLALENLKRFHLIEDNARFRRSLKECDKISGSEHKLCRLLSKLHDIRRQTIKIGVVYVAEGQEDQKIILKNDAGSKEYNDFLMGLGWTVSIHSTLLPTKKPEDRC